MRWRATAAVVCLAGCAHRPPTATIAPEVAGDGRSCEQPIVVHAPSDREATRWEYAWLAKHYPGRQPNIEQGLMHKDGRIYDELRFTDAEGKPAFVCFDITHTFGT